MAQRDYYLGRIGGSRLWVWTTTTGEVITPATPDSGISGRILRKRWRLVLGAPTGARSFVWSPRSYTPEPDSDSGISGRTIRTSWRLIFGSPVGARNIVYRRGQQPVAVVTDSGINGSTAASPHLYYLGRPGGSRLWAWRAAGTTEAATATAFRRIGIIVRRRSDPPLVRMEVL